MKNVLWRHQRVEVAGISTMHPPLFSNYQNLSFNYQLTIINYQWSILKFTSYYQCQNFKLNIVLSMSKFHSWQQNYQCQHFKFDIKLSMSKFQSWHQIINVKVSNLTAKFKSNYFFLSSIYLFQSWQQKYLCIKLSNQSLIIWIHKSLHSFKYWSMATYFWGWQSNMAHNSGEYLELAIMINSWPQFK